MADVPIGDVLKDDQLAAFCKALPKAELHQHMSGSFRRVSLLSASYVQYLLHFFFFLFPSHLPLLIQTCRSLSKNCWKWWRLNWATQTWLLQSALRTYLYTCIFHVVTFQVCFFLKWWRYRWLTARLLPCGLCHPCSYTNGHGWDASLVSGILIHHDHLHARQHTISSKR